MLDVVRMILERKASRQLYVSSVCDHCLSYKGRLGSLWGKGKESSGMNTILFWLLTATCADCTAKIRLKRINENEVIMRKVMPTSERRFPGGREAGKGEQELTEEDRQAKPYCGNPYNIKFSIQCIKSRVQKDRSVVWKETSSF